jgi:hypothetical protein
MSHYLSYAEQAAHYFDRPHEEVLREPPLSSPAAWRGPDLAARDDWRMHLDAGQVAELEAALRAAEATGKPTAELTAGNFPLPTLAAEVARWRAELERGRGFQVVSGVPVERWSQAEAERAFWCLGLHMGRPGAQNAAGDLLGHVTDLGEDVADPHVRLYRTAADIAYHCDAADVVGLLCLRPARRGGLSRIVSSVSVYAELLRRRPDLVPRLYEPFALDVRSEGDRAGLRWIAIPPCRYAGGRLRTFYHSDYFRSVARHDDAPALTATERELLDLYETTAADPDLYLDMELRAGDVQWLSNHVILHARTAYEDEPGSKRHLLRLWLSLED